jgi:beta-N-acetylhexosaminidase
MLTPLLSEQQQWVDATLNAMTLPQCVEQLLCPSNPRSTTDEWLDLIKKVPIGALSVRNATSAETRERMQRLQEQSPIPILAGGDMEHGAEPLVDSTKFPWPMAAGAANDAELMTIMGRATAAEARYAGMHWNFSPVIDLNYNFNNPITNVRAISDDPERVSRLATAMIKGLHEMPHLPNLLAAYGDSTVSQRAAVKVWLGEIAAQGDCPVRLPQVTIRPLSV